LPCFFLCFLQDEGNSRKRDQDEQQHQQESSKQAEDGFLLKTSSLTEQGTRSAYSEGIIHTVEPNESIESIAKMSFLKPETIRWANNLGVKDTVKTGQKLLILPVDGVLHNVKRGQNLQTIADLYGVPADQISRQNRTRFRNHLMTNPAANIKKPDLVIRGKGPHLLMHP